MQYGMIHKFASDGYYLVLDVNSNTLHSVTKPIYDILDFIAPPFSENIPESLYGEKALSYLDEETLSECWAEIRELYDAGMLYSALPELDSAAMNFDSMPIKSMCLHIAHDCNMRCRYCFAETGSFHSERSMMSYETGKAALDFLYKASGKIRNLEVDFFGGEPLMNFDVVKSLVTYAREREKTLDKHIRFTITTNGSLLDDESIAFINENTDNAVLSCDGRREIHDFMRPAEDGSGTYDTIMPAFKKLVAERGEKSYYIRGTYTRKNLDFSRDVLAMAAEGFDQISVEPVVLSPESPYSIREEDLPRIRAEYDVLAAELIRRKQKKEGMFNFFHFMVDLDEGPCIYKRIKGCGSGREYISVTPTGDIYPCHQFVGKTEFMMGNVFEGSIDQKIRKQFTRAAVLSIPKCRDCWAKFFCGGGCAANNYSFNSDINIPYSIGCETERKRLECALMLKAAENGEPLEAESPEAKSFEAKKAQH